MKQFLPTTEKAGKQYKGISSHVSLLSKAFLLSALITFPGCESKAQNAPAGEFSVFANSSIVEQSREILPTLNDFLARRKNALLFLEQTPTESLQPVTLEARTTAEQRAGARRIRIRDFQIISDSDTNYAGYNLGPSSPESALAVIASDLADAFISQAALKGISLDSLEVEVKSRPELSPNTEKVVYPRNLLYTAYIQSSASDVELEELRRTVEKHSPIFNLILEPQEINGDIDYTQSPQEVTIPEGGQPGLREYLKYKRVAYLHLRSEAEKRANDPQAKPSGGIRARVKVEGGTGVRRIYIRQFQILHDNPAYLAGTNLGPTSQEHQLGVLTSCITHIFLIQAAAREIPLDSLSVTAKGVSDIRAGRPGFEQTPAYPQQISYTVNVHSPVSYQEISDLRDAVEAVCPIYNLLKEKQQVEGAIVRGSYKE